MDIRRFMNNIPCIQCTIETTSFYGIFEIFCAFELFLRLNCYKMMSLILCVNFSQQFGI